MGYLATYIIEEVLDYFDNKEDKFLSFYKENCKMGYKDKANKWKEILRNDLRDKFGYTESDITSYLSSDFSTNFFNVYLKQMYIYYFEMGFARFQPYEQEVINGLKPLIDKTGSEMFSFIQSNVSNDMFTKVIGPIAKSFINNAWEDGQGFAANVLLKSYRK